ncbi:MAG TPA: hypothetical protein EYH31_02835 [Anaerolineae bacterium]|nr:hypothetical protein [Anaerolineae bacterium]
MNLQIPVVVGCTTDDSLDVAILIPQRAADSHVGRRRNPDEIIPQPHVQPQRFAHHPAAVTTGIVGSHRHLLAIAQIVLAAEWAGYALPSQVAPPSILW